MAHTKEEIYAAQEYAAIETERYKETHPSKYENDGSNKYFAQCKSDFLAGITFHKEQPITCPECGAKIRHGLPDKTMELIKNSNLFKK